MYRVAVAILRQGGLADDAADAVNDAIVSIMKKPPQNVVNWEAFLVNAVKRKAQDRLKSAYVRHSGPALQPSVHDRDSGTSVVEEVLDGFDRSRAAELAEKYLSALNARLRQVVWDTVALERSRDDVARDLGVSPSRISQMRTEGLSILRQTMTREEEVDE